MSGTGGVSGRSFASAMMCSKVMSVCVHTSTTHTSCGVPLWLCATAVMPLVGVRRITWTTMGSRLMASTTASSCSTLEKSRPFTWRKQTAERQFEYIAFEMLPLSLDGDLVKELSFWDNLTYHLDILASVILWWKDAKPILFCNIWIRLCQWQNIQLNVLSLREKSQWKVQ